MLICEEQDVQVPRSSWMSERGHMQTALFFFAYTDVGKEREQDAEALF